MNKSNGTSPETSGKIALTPDQHVPNEAGIDQARVDARERTGEFENEAKERILPSDPGETDRLSERNNNEHK